MRYEAILLLLLLLAAGCAERAWIRSAPPGANVYVNGHFIGITPVVYSVHRPEFNRPLRYRLECDGYGAVEGELQKRIGTPRIVGACFTLGLSLLFKPLTTLQERYDIALERTPKQANVAPPPAPDTPSRAASEAAPVLRVRPLGSLSEAAGASMTRRLPIRVPSRPRRRKVVIRTPSSWSASRL